MEYSTRISDLPENITMGFSQGSSQSFGQGSSQQQQLSFATENGLDIPPLPGTYTQMNVHPNPYGQPPPQQGAIPPPQHTHTSRTPQQLQQGQGVVAYLGNPEQPPHLKGMPQYPLQNRDVVQDQSYYQQDESIKPNYIPQPTQNHDSNYVYEQEDRVKRQRRAKKGKLFSDWKFDDMVAELQQPIIVALLFLIFQAPTINNIIAKYLSFMHFFGEDGDLNTSGILFKSAMFGACYLAFGKFMLYIDQ